MVRASALRRAGLVIGTFAAIYAMVRTRNGLANVRRGCRTNGASGTHRNTFPPRARYAHHRRSAFSLRFRPQ
jgi:hypothetical protein